MFDDKDYLELPDVDEDKKRREKIYNKVEKILDKSGIKYDAPKEKVRKFIDNQISLNGNYELFISVEGDENLPKICSAINKEIAEFNGHVARDNYNFLVLTCESAMNETFLKSTLIKNYKPKGYISLNNFTKIKIDKYNYKKYKFNSDIYYYNKDRENIIWINENNEVVCLLVINKKSDPNHIWISELEVNEKYHGYNLGNQVLEYAISHMGANTLRVMHDNEVAKRMYEKHGFIVSDESKKEIKEGKSKVYLMYLNHSINETSFKSKIDKNYKPKGHIDLSNFREIAVDESNFDKYKNTGKIKIVNPGANTRIWFDKDDNYVGILSVDTSNYGKYKGYNWIVVLEVSKKYQQYGIGDQLIDYAIKNMHANALGVDYDNEVAKRMYEKHGFIVSDESKKEIKEGKSKVYLMYLNHSINETSFKSKFKYGYKSKSYIPLSRYKEVKIYESNYNHYKSQSKVLSHLNPLSDIRIWIDTKHNNNIVAIAAVDNTLRPGCNWITALEVNEKYRGHKLGKQILDYAVVNMGGNALGVKYDNEVAKHMYEKYGFKISQKSIERVKNKETSAYHMYYESSVDELELPDKADYATDINELLNITNHSRVFLTSDWHLFANHYDHDSKGINKQKIISWCKSNIKDNDVFIYLGDISYRYANDTDIENAKKIMKSIPGIKVLVLGNHDKMLGDEFYAECGFTLIYDSFEWNEIIFTHRPINMAVYPSRYWNIHGHIHDRVDYYTMEGDHNINVYPSFYDNKPVTLEYILNHKEELVKNHYWNKEMSGFFTEAVNDNYPTVYYCDKINSDTITYMASLFSDHLKGRIAIKLHVGEEGNQNALKPNLLRGLVKYTHGTFVDSNVAYESKRATTEGHKETAEKHGFTKLAYFDVLDADGDMVIQVPYQNQINKGLKELKVKGTEIPVMTPGPHLKEVNVGSHLSSYDSMIVYTHFKGHTMAGYGGAVKNIGMGIPSGKVGKIQVHGKDFRRNPEFLERLVEAAAAVEDYFKGHIIYINVLKNISVDCDCDAVAHDPTISDIGVLVSNNLYAIEQASLDLIRNAPHNKDIMERIASRGGVHQLEYMKFLGMAPDGYVLKDLNNRKIKLEATIINETKRSELPDSAFGIPEDRKYPLDTEQHVKSAIKLFGHAEESKKKALAQRIRTAAKKYDLSIPETTQCYKYLNEGGLEEMIPVEVHNIIFDLHGVLIGDTVETVIEHGLVVPHHIAHEISDILHEIFNKSEMRHYDIKQVREYFINNVPEYMKKYADKIFFELLPNMVNEYPYTYELIDTFRNKGYNLYYLSNLPNYVYDAQEAFFVPFLNKLDGGLFDFKSQYTKPQKEFFMEFLDEYNLNPSSCLFIDNLAENTAVAEDIGMYTILFDHNETPKILLSGKYKIPPDVNNTILIDSGKALEAVNINSISNWCIESFNEFQEEYKSGCPLHYSDFKSALQDEYSYRMAYDDNKKPIESYAFIRGKDFEPVLAGKLIIYPDKTHQWQVQYPLKLNEDGRTYSSSVSGINEWAMAACNPIVGISKPFVLKISNDNGSIINTKQYALSPDIIADKYFVVNENANIEIVDSKTFENCYIEAYECTLNRLPLVNRLSTIHKAYATKQTVDSTIFYTALAGKPMLSEDQIDFDIHFKKVDFELLKETAITKLATMVDEFNSITKYPYHGISFPITEGVAKAINSTRCTNNNIINYGKYKDISIREDADGYYVYSTLTKLRSKSVSNMHEITDQMFKSVLKK